MSLSQLLRSPFARIPFLAFAVFSSVATSQPDSGWRLRAQIAAEEVTLQRNAAFERRVDYATSETGVELHVTLSGLSSPSGKGKIRVVIDTCGVDMVFASTGGAWSGPEQSELVYGGYERVVISAKCPASSGTIKIRIENLDRSSISFTSSVDMSIGGDTPDAPPDGAFVRMLAAP